MEEFSMMEEYAFLLVTDTHFRPRNFSSRVDYEKESEFTYESIINAIEHHKAKGRKIILIFMGDLFHDSFTGIEKAMYWLTKIIRLCLSVENTFFLVGNHEITYAKDNPTWALMQSLDTKRINPFDYKKSFSPKGAFDFVNVVDTLEFGNVKFYFNHYGTNILSPPVNGMINIGLFHQDVYSKKMVEDARLTYGIDIFEHTPVYFDEGTPVLEGYDYAFMGHNHLSYGTWKFTHPITGSEVIIYNLGSLGRTNHKEVNDDFLERNIPAVIVKGREFQGVEDYKFNLWTREQSVNEAQVSREQNKRAVAKDTKELKKIVKYTENPMENLRLKLKRTDSHLHVHILEQAMQNKKVSINFENFGGIINDRT